MSLSAIPDQVESPATEPPAPPPASWRTDTLTEGVILLLALAITQRMIGFLRGVLFCRWLPAEELGHWDLVFSFMLLAAPLAVLGIPGSFVRYVEHYRQRGQLQGFLRRSGVVIAVLTTLSTLGMIVFRRPLARLIFDDGSLVGLVGLAIVALVAVIAFNGLTELFTAMRRQRIVALMQLASTLIFASLGTVLLLVWRLSASSVLVAYGVSCAAAALLGGIVLWRTLGGSKAWPHERLHHGDLWPKLLPFAFWVWVVNLSANLFAVADRYMIVHYSGLSPQASAGLVGNYHSSRVVPLLMAAVSGMLGGLIVPHLVHDWEGGDRSKVSARLNTMLKCWGFVLLTGGVTILALAPIMFGWVLAGRYDGGLAVLPTTVTYCVWFGMLLVAQSYLWCVEKIRLGSLVFFTGLVVNVALNAWLLPRYGLPGAVLATAGGQLTALVLLYALNRKLGLRLHRGVWIVTALPLSLAWGATVSAIVLLAGVAAALSTDWIFTPQEKTQLVDTLRRYNSRIAAWRLARRQASSAS